MLFRFCLYGFLKNQRYFEPFFLLVLLRDGFSFLDFGLLTSLRQLTVNLLEIPSGVVADSVGRRLSMIASFVAYLASFVAFFLADAWATYAVAMVLLGVGDSFRTGTHKAMIFEWLRRQGREDERTRVYGFTRSWSQLGSAVSSLIAALLVALVNDLQWVFLFAAGPYLLNLLNLAAYPASLDGEHERAASLGDLWRNMLHGVREAVGNSELRGLMLESAGWEGFFIACKDYLQPLLAAVAAGLAAAWFPGAATDEPRTAALLIGPAYFLLYLLSAAASRQSHRVVEAAGSTAAATRRLWLAHGGVCLLLLAAGWRDWRLLLATGFVLLHAGQNLWRPILVSRFDEFGDPATGATLLSVESQVRRVGALLLAPLLGWLMDLAADGEAVRYWPVGGMGVLVTVAVLAARRERRASP